MSQPTALRRWREGQSPREVLERVLAESDHALDVVVIARDRDDGITVECSDAWKSTALGLVAAALVWLASSMATDPPTQGA